MQNEIHTHTIVIFGKWIVGTVFPVLAVLSSFQENIEWSIRIFAMLVAATSSIISIYSLLKSRSKYKKKEPAWSFNLKKKSK